MLRSTLVPANRPSDTSDSLAAKASQTGSNFEADALRVLSRLRWAIAQVIESTPGDARRAADLRKSLDLDAALSWQIHTLATSGDALRAGRVVPKAGAMERFFKAARAHRLPEEVTREAQQAYAEFERFVLDQAGTRETFDAMLSALCPDDGAALQRIRRAAYKANAAVWGVTVRCTIHCVVFNQRPTGEHDCLAIRGRVGLRRLQENAVIGIYASGRTWGGGACPPEGAPKVALDRCELLERYCSSPAMRVKRVEAPDGTVRDFLQLEGLGRSSEVTAFWKNLSLNFPDGTTKPPHGVTSPIVEATEVLVTDLLVPRGWTDPKTAQVAVTENSRYSIVGTGVETQHLPFEGAAEHLGADLEGLYTRHAPKYSEIVINELGSLGWKSTTFDIYRSVALYPVMHSAVHLWVGGE